MKTGMIPGAGFIGREIRVAPQSSSERYCWSIDDRLMECSSPEYEMSGEQTWRRFTIQSFSAGTRFANGSIRKSGI